MSATLSAAAFAAVLFDMDGTLSDTEHVWQEAEAHVAETHGTGRVGTDPSLVGGSMAGTARFLQERCGVALSVDEIAAAATAAVLASIRSGFAWRPGAVELLAEARAAGLPTALVTTSPRVVVEAVVAQLPSGAFDLRVATEDVAATKPDPAPYLPAADRLGVGHLDRRRRGAQAQGGGVEQAGLDE